MNARTSHLAVAPVRGSGCGCGCDCTGECGSRCCDLECLVRPNYYCGQLLTDADLAAMVEWTRHRLALARYRDGWGIACGLDLSCSLPGGSSSCCGDATDGPAIYLNPGYAVDCCGNDLVVCEPTRIDLSSVCTPPDDPCHPRPAAAAAVTPAGAQGAAARAGCLSIDRDNLFVVQVMLRYHEDLSRGQRAIFRGDCSDAGPCEYARVLERPCIHLEEVPLDSANSDTQDEQAWNDAFRVWVGREIESIRKLVAKGLDAVAHDLDRNPPYQLCFIKEVVCCLRDANATPTPEELDSVGRYLLFDRLLRHLQCGCTTCRPDNGVALGRVFMRRTQVAGKTQCSIVMVDQSGTARRPLRKDVCRPLSDGNVDLVAHLWQAPEVALRRLRALGVKVTPATALRGGAMRVHQLSDAVLEAQVLTFDPLSQGALIAHIANDYFDTPRIAAFELVP